MGWSMDRQEIRTSFDRESRRLKQIELSGSHRERVSLRTYPNELSAREAEVCQDAEYGEWCKPLGPPERVSPFGENASPGSSDFGVTWALSDAPWRHSHPDCRSLLTLIVARQRHMI
jgi:hypothetical protein